MALLRDAKLSKIKVGTFALDPAAKSDLNRLSVRAATCLSPYNQSYASYLREALVQELSEAGALDGQPSAELAGILIRNEVHAGGISKADAVIEARFVVKQGERLRYDKIKTAKIEWDSHFMGDIALARAMENYPFTVQKLLSALYSDPEFLAAFHN